MKTFSNGLEQSELARRSKVCGSERTLNNINKLRISSLFAIILIYTNLFEL